MEAKILLVDDTPEVLFALGAVLQSLGCYVVQASSGREAFALLKTHHFDLFLLDAQMPDMSGIEIARQLMSRRQQSYLPIMMMSEERPDVPGTGGGFGCGEIDVLLKPINPRELKLKVGIFLDLVENRDTLEGEAVALAYLAKRIQYVLGVFQNIQYELLPRLRDPVSSLIGVVAGLQKGEYGAAHDRQLPALQHLERQGQELFTAIRELSAMVTLKARPAMAAKLARADRQQPSSAAPSEQQRILVVEDNAVNAMTLIHSLTSYGYKVFHAQNGREALELTQREIPDLIVMDIQLPEMDGLEVTRRIRKDEAVSDIPIIALSALAMPTDKELGLEAGVDLYLTKPVRLKELAEIIKQFVSR